MVVWCVDSDIWRLAKRHPDAALLHCISGDLWVANVEQEQMINYTGPPTPDCSPMKSGDVATLSADEGRRTVFYVASRAARWHAPFTGDVVRGLARVVQHCKEHNIGRLIVPRSASLAAGVSWGEGMDTLLAGVTANSGLEVYICDRRRHLARHQ